MTTEVSQLRPEGIEAAAEFARSVGFDIRAKDIDQNISLITQLEHEIIAAVIGVHNPGGACDLHVCLGKLEDPAQVTSDLLDKALMKVCGSGVRRCQFSYHGTEDQPVDWPGAKWCASEDEHAEAPPAVEQVAEAEDVAEVETEPDTVVEVEAEAEPIPAPETNSTIEAVTEAETTPVADPEAKTVEVAAEAVVAEVDPATIEEADAEVAAELEPESEPELAEDNADSDQKVTAEAKPKSSVEAA